MEHGVLWETFHPQSGGWLFSSFTFTPGGVLVVRTVRRQITASAWLESRTAEQDQLPLGSGQSHAQTPSRGTVCSGDEQWKQNKTTKTRPASSTNRLTVAPTWDQGGAAQLKQQKEQVGTKTERKSIYISLQLCL